VVAQGQGPAAGESLARLVDSVFDLPTWERGRPAE